MRFFTFILFFFLLQSCTKPKTVLICGDHVCVNKNEAEQYFEENLTIEVKIINKKNKKSVDLVELNLKDNIDKDRQIIIEEKNETKEVVKILSDKEIKKIKNQIKKKRNNKKVVKNNINKKIDNKDSVFNQNKVSIKDNEVKKLVINDKKSKKKVVDICTIIKKCSIDQISKYLLKQGKKKDFPSLSAKE
jgi:hypothetical protein